MEIEGHPSLRREHHLTRRHSAKLCQAHTHTRQDARSTHSLPTTLGHYSQTPSRTNSQTIASQILSRDKHHREPNTVGSQMSSPSQNIIQANKPLPAEHRCEPHARCKPNTLWRAKRHYEPHAVAVISQRYFKPNTAAKKMPVRGHAITSQTIASRTSLQVKPSQRHCKSTSSRAKHRCEPMPSPFRASAVQSHVEEQACLLGLFRVAVPEASWEIVRIQCGSHLSMLSNIPAHTLQLPRCGKTVLGRSRHVRDICITPAQGTRCITKSLIMCLDLMLI